MAFNAVLSALYDVARDTFDYRHVDYLPKHKKLATSLMDIITQAVLEEGNVTSSTGGGSDNVSSLGQEPHKSADKRPGGGRVEMTKKIKLQDPELIDVSGDSLSDDEYDASSSGHEANLIRTLALERISLNQTKQSRLAKRILVAYHQCHLKIWHSK